MEVHRAEQFSDVELIYYITDANGRTERLVQGFPMRYFFRYEVEHLLARCGFSIVDVFGDCDKSPLGDNSPEMIFVARKAESMAVVTSATARSDRSPLRPLHALRAMETTRRHWPVTLQ